MRPCRLALGIPASRRSPVDASSLRAPLSGAIVTAQPTFRPGQWIGGGWKFRDDRVEHNGHVTRIGSFETKPTLANDLRWVWLRSRQCCQRRGIRVLELLPRTVWRQGAGSEATGTYWRRVRGGKLQRSGGVALCQRQFRDETDKNQWYRRFRRLETASAAVIRGRRSAARQRRVRGSGPGARVRAGAGGGRRPAGRGPARAAGRSRWPSGTGYAPRGTRRGGRVLARRRVRFGGRRRVAVRRWRCGRRGGALWGGGGVEQAVDAGDAAGRAVAGFQFGAQLGAGEGRVTGAQLVDEREDRGVGQAGRARHAPQDSK